MTTPTLTPEQIAAAVEVAEATHAYHAHVAEHSAANDKLRRALMANDPHAAAVAAATLSRLDDYEAVLGPLCDRGVKARKAWAAVRPA